MNSSLLKFLGQNDPKNVIKDNPKILGIDAPNPNTVGQKIWVATIQTLLVATTQKVWDAMTQRI